MVDRFAGQLFVAQSSAFSPLLAVDQKAQPLLSRLSPEQRARVLMAILGLVLLGIGLMVLTLLGGRYFRRIVGKPTPPLADHENQWYRKPLVPREPPSPPAHDPP